MRALLFAFFLFALSTLVSGEIDITIASGKHDRVNAIVQFTAPAGVENGLHRLTDSKGQMFLQVDNGIARCVIPTLAANESRTFRYDAESGTLKPGQGVFFEKGDVATQFVINGTPVFAYNHAKTALPEKYEPQFQRGGYIYPLFSPSGVPVLDDYPHNHKHHHGIWMAWTKTKYEDRAPDFWNMGMKFATIEPVALDQTWSGAVNAGFVARHKFVDLKAPEPLIVLNETWTTRLFASNDMRVFDLEIKQDCATNAPLKLPKYHYGGIGFRGHKQWDGKANSEFLSSEGKVRADGNETTSKWCALSGKSDGKQATLAILCHPENFRFPQPMRLHPDEPFFCYAPQQGGEFAIEPGKPYLMKYRFVVTDGAPDAALLNKLWNDYAEPATAK